MPPERAVMAEHLCAQPAAGGDAGAVRSALSAAVVEAATHQKRPALRCVCWVGDGGATPSDEPAQRGRRAAKEWPEDRIEGKLRHQVLYVGERKRSFDGTGGGGACVIPVLAGVPSRRER